MPKLTLEIAVEFGDCLDQLAGQLRSADATERRRAVAEIDEVRLGRFLSALSSALTTGDAQGRAFPGSRGIADALVRACSELIELSQRAGSGAPVQFTAIHGSSAVTEVAVPSSGSKLPVTGADPIFLAVKLELEMLRLLVPNVSPRRDRTAHFLAQCRRFGKEGYVQQLRQTLSIADECGDTVAQDRLRHYLALASAPSQAATARTATVSLVPGKRDSHPVQHADDIATRLAQSERRMTDPESRERLAQIDWGEWREQSVLGVLGYKVGATGRYLNERHDILVDALVIDLEFIADREYRRDWGPPRSQARFRRVCRHLEWLIERRKDYSADYSQAIADWKEDVEWFAQFKDVSE